MTWRAVSMGILSFLNITQLLIAIVVFLWYGWEEKKINARLQEKDVELRMSEAELKKTESETLQAAVKAMKSSDSYLIGGEILKVIFSRDQPCLTEDQYMVVDFLAELYNKTAETPAPREMFLDVMRKRPNCIASMPPVISNATDGYVVVGTPKYSCPACITRRVIDFSNFGVLSGLEGTTLTGKIPVGAVIKAKIEINLRANSSDIEAGGNPVLRTLQSDQCASVKESLARLRGNNTWASVTLRDCP